MRHLIVRHNAGNTALRAVTVRKCITGFNRMGVIKASRTRFANQDCIFERVNSPRYKGCQHIPTTPKPIGIKTILGLNKCGFRVGWNVELTLHAYTHLLMVGVVVFDKRHKRSAES